MTRYSMDGLAVEICGVREESADSVAVCFSSQFL